MKQHFVPRSYLAAWTDPATPEGQEPYVWVIPPNGGTGKKQAPKNVFTETDFYTFKNADVGDELVLEKGLAQLEQRFVSLRESVLEKRRPLSEQDTLVLCAFASAMRGRTRVRREHIRGQWRRVLDMGESLRQQASRSTPEERAALGGLVPEGGTPAATMDDVKELVDNPITATLAQRVEVEVPFLLQFDIAILNTGLIPGFITSDHPCIRRIPEQESIPLNQRLSGTVHPETEITLPISPRQLVVLSLSPVNGYQDCSPAGVGSYNQRTWMYADEGVIACVESTQEDWFACR
jgi:hypothetical protein